MTATRILRRAEVLRYVGLGKTTLYELISREEFPRPVQLGPRAVGWRAEEVEAWLDSRQYVSSAAQEASERVLAEGAEQ